ncbi:MAG: hypothetical protein JNM78_04175 [Cyclobacteriaceae bacterium]|nr:hypothetical protein [Cyclobacteriaceae bacterium]
MNIEGNIKSNLIVLLILLVFLPFSATSQIKQTARFEREHKSNDKEFILVSLKEKGLVLVRDKEKYKEGKQLWEIIRLDTELKEIWSVELYTESRLRIVGYEYKDDLVYLLYREGEHEASDLTLYTIDIDSKDVRKHVIKQELTFKVTHFSALSHTIALGGYVTNEPAILLYHLENEVTKLVPGFFVSDTELLDLRVNTNNTFNVLIAVRNAKHRKKLILKTFDAQGALLIEDEMEIDSKKAILSGICSTLINDELFIAGTWTEGNSKQASGIYTSLIDPFSDQVINFYDFGQFDHFLDYQNPKRVAKLKQRSQQAGKAGEIPDFKTYAIPMRLEEQPEGFALLTEVYLPSTSLNSYPYWNNFSSPYYNGYSPYGYNPFMNRYYSAPYQYNSQPSGETKMLYASLIVFDTQGKKNYDYGIKLEDKKVGGLEQTADFMFYKENFALAFKKDKEVKFISGHPEETVEKDTLTSELSYDETVRNDSDDNSAIRLWYQNVFYSWGYQSIRDRSPHAESPTRYVFYINKIEVR